MKLFFLIIFFLTGCCEQIEIDSSQIMRHAETLISFGYRVSGSKELENSANYIIKELEKGGIKAEKKVFSAETPIGKIDFINVEAMIIGKNSEKFIILSSHYDLKMMEPRMDGANDGVSSTALLIELAKQIKNPPYDVKIIFFDGEECIGKNYTETDGLYGSRFSASQIDASKCVAMINLDMVGDINLGYTLSADTDLSMYRKLLSAAKKSGNDNLVTICDMKITDDHTPFQQKGIKTLNIIDFDYPFWHTPEDNLSKISENSLNLTGQIVMELINSF